MGRWFVFLSPVVKAFFERGRYTVENSLCGNRVQPALCKQGWNCESSFLSSINAVCPRGRKWMSINPNFHPITYRQINLQTNQMSSFSAYLDLAHCPASPKLLIIILSLTVCLQKKKKKRKKEKSLCYEYFLSKELFTRKDNCLGEGKFASELAACGNRISGWDWSVLCP